jgi:hypothetical protein
VFGRCGDPIVGRSLPIDPNIHFRTFFFPGKTDIGDPGDFSDPVHYQESNLSGGFLIIATDIDGYRVIRASVQHPHTISFPDANPYPEYP